MTITIELPDDLAERAGLDRDEASRVATAATLGAVAAFADRAENEEADPEVVAAGREAIEDGKAGRLLTLEQVDANLEAALATRRNAGTRSQQQRKVA